MKKYYRLKKDTFLWKQGAILVSQPTNGTCDKEGYFPEEDIWDTTPENKGEYISARIIEHPNSVEWFERVYPDNMTGRLYHTKDQLIQKYNQLFNSGGKNEISS